MKKDKLNYADALEELETILEQVENAELNVDDLILKVKRAAQLIEICKSKLFSIEKDVEDILGNMK